MYTQARNALQNSRSVLESSCERGDQILLTIWISDNTRLNLLVSVQDLNGTTPRLQVHRDLSGGTKYLSLVVESVGRNPGIIIVGDFPGPELADANSVICVSDFL